MKKTILITALSILTTNATAGLILNKTRIIYPENAKEVNLQISNNGDKPYAAQVWINTRENESKRPNDENSAPFFISPIISKIAPKEGQTVRIIFTGDALPNDRESIFYFNLLQIPSQTEATTTNNKLNILIQDVLKVFYRPKTLNNLTDKISEEISFNLVNKNGRQAIKAINPTGLYMSFTNANISVNDNKIPLNSGMVAPFSEETWPIPENAPAIKDAELNIEYVNDYGGFKSINRKL